MVKAMSVGPVKTGKYFFKDLVMIGLQKEVRRRAGGVPLPCKDWASSYFTEIAGLPLRRRVR